MPHADPTARRAYNTAYVRRRYTARRAEAIAILGGCCVDCGAADKPFEIDHEDWRDKALRPVDFHTCSRARFLAELSKCRLRCEDCHHAKSRGPGGDISAAKRHYNAEARGETVSALDPEVAEELLYIARQIRRYAERQPGRY